MRASGSSNSNLLCLLLNMAATLVLEADEKIEVPNNIWSAEQKDYFIKTIFDVLTGTLSIQEFEENLENKQK